MHACMHALSACSGNEQKRCYSAFTGVQSVAAEKIRQETGRERDRYEEGGKHRDNRDRDKRSRDKQRQKKRDREKTKTRRDN